MSKLAPLVGEWTMKAFGGEARSEFAWELGGRYLVQRTEIPHPPEAPDSLILYAPAEGGGFLQHYFDSRGVVRLYEMTFDGSAWTLLRQNPDFSPLDFRQRFMATVDGDVIEGRWESAQPGRDYELDFELRYVRREA